MKHRLPRGVVFLLLVGNGHAQSLRWDPLFGYLPGRKQWNSVASSSDGNRLIALVDNADIWTSADAGETWTDRQSAGSRNWSSVASSSDGISLVAVVRNGSIWTSADAGETWIDRQSAGSRDWSSVASSSDGTRLVAIVRNGNIWTSADAGKTWIDRQSAGSRDWSSVASSSDGIRLVAVVRNGNIWTSTDSGGTWIDRQSAGSKYWSSVGLSSDGTRLIAVVGLNQQDPKFAVGNIWISMDFGETWGERRASPGTLSQWWGSVVVSDSGTRIAAVEQKPRLSDGRACYYVWISWDGGRYWRHTLTKCVPVRRGSTFPPCPIASSSDGYKLIYAAYNLNLYSSYKPRNAFEVKLVPEDEIDPETEG